MKIKLARLGLDPMTIYAQTETVNLPTKLYFVVEFQAYITQTQHKIVEMKVCAAGK
jgi:hypothetical protein